ncbi:MAG: acylneuraminate cytidylyltransferase family protein [Bacillota bacterium]|nr:acylneuraminate cytidylyltransferase family protein [Bacillota bacterium]MDW7678744.1 acylneuraminate cytidylyltransferase family protein [Bacillota bacterium]
MIGNARVVALIPARGGSKSVKNKNIKLLGGKPLLAWSIDAAANTPEIDSILVSTEDPTIKAVAREYGAEPIDRPRHLAQDDSLVIDTVRQVIAHLDSQNNHYDMMVLLEPTCPFRSSQDISDCLKMIVDKDQACDSVATFVEAAVNPHRTWKIREGVPSVFIEGAVPWLPRQQLPAAYQLNGAVYAFKTSRLSETDISLLTGKCGAVIMPPERSVDIDTYLDFELAEIIINKKAGEASE